MYRQFYNNKLSLAQKISEGNINDVDYISGADIFIRSEVFNMVEGFDYDYFMYSSVNFVASNSYPVAPNEAIAPRVLKGVVRFV